MNQESVGSRIAVAETAIRRLEAKVSQSSDTQILVDETETYSLRSQPFWFSDFLTANSAQNFPVAFTGIGSGTMARQAQPARNHPGVVSMGSAAGADSGAHQYYFSAQNITVLGGGEQTTWIFSPRVASNTNTTIRMGFIDTTTVADCVDGCYFEIQPGSLNILAKTSSNSSRTTSSALCTLVVNTWYRVVVTVSPTATSVLFEVFLSDTGKLLGSTTITSNIPTGSGRETGCGAIATNSAGGSVHLAHLDYSELWFGVDNPLIR